MKTHHLRRLRILQHLQHAFPNPMGEALLLKLLEEDDELNPDAAKVLRSLIWLKDARMIQLDVIETTTGSMAVATMSYIAKAYLNGDFRVKGLAHPHDCISDNNA